MTDPLLNGPEAQALVEQIEDDAVRALVLHAVGSVVAAVVDGRHGKPAFPIDLAFLVRTFSETFADPVTIARVALGDLDAGDPFGNDPLR